MARSRGQSPEWRASIARERRRRRTILQYVFIGAPLYLLMGVVFQGIVFGEPVFNFMTALHVVVWPLYAPFFVIVLCVILWVAFLLMSMVWALVMAVALQR